MADVFLPPKGMAVSDKDSLGQIDSIHTGVGMAIPGL